jgi:hypothetical protein
VDKAALQRPDLLAGRTPRTINMSTIGDDLLRPASPEPSARRSKRWWSTTATRWRWRPESGKVVRGFAREDLFTVVLEQFQTDTVDYADYVLPATTQLEHWDIHSAYGHTDVLLNRPAIAPMAARPTPIFRELAARMGFDEACFTESDETSLCRQAFGDRIDFNGLLAQGFTSLQIPEAPFADGASPRRRAVRVLQRTGAAGPRRPARPPAELRTVPAASQRYPLAMISPPARNFLNSTFVNVAEPARHRGRAAAGTACRRRRATRHPRRLRWCGSSTTAASYLLQGEGQPARPARRGHGLGIWWRKMGLDGTNVNQLTSQR